MARPKAKARTSSNYTSIYLDEDSREKLDALHANTGQSRSMVVRGLIQQADGSNQVRIAELVAELADLLHLR